MKSSLQTCHRTPSHKFQSILLHCHLTSNFETCAPNEPQMTVDTTMWKVHQMYPTPSSESQISTRFRKSAGNDPRNDLNCNMHGVTSKWPWTQWCQRYPLYVVSVPLSSKFQTVLPFSSYRPFRHKCTEWPQMTLNTTKSRYTMYVIPSVPTINTIIEVRILSVLR